jgi:CheY-like chemotaxis protein
MARTILVVEDDNELRTALVEILAGEGFIVEEARNGLEGLRKLRAGLSPAVILLDLMMPVMDGWQFLAERRRDARLRAYPVVVMSAVDQASRPPPADDFLSKPAGLDAILAIIDTHCRRPQRSR